MDYELERALRDKADKWEIHNLQSKLSDLERQNQQLQREINNCEGRINSQMRAIDTLLGLLIEKELMPEYADTLQNLRQYL